MIDLHTHSNISDGTDSPGALIEKAASLGISTISLTDHDNISGLKDAQDYADANNILFVPGIELSVTDSYGELHLLGYNIDYKDPGMKLDLEDILDSRVIRNKKMLQKVQELGFDISYNELLEEAGTGQIGRLHFAKCFTKRGYVDSIAEAFEKYFSEGKPGFVPRYTFDSKEAISFIKKYKGVTVLAHPSLYSLSDEDLDGLLKKLKSYGLDGIEAYYPEHSGKSTANYCALAQKYNLFVTGGSDYHGSNIPAKKLGMLSENNMIPIKCIDFL